ncbi:hypothetical protein BWQ96_10088 [Gracilariopsis chorda]|uniref:Uncharacterized protein n=1 Tax=Gracilariopsis chorda TaxID=448386 RepID=A0A2V3IDU5_9FLOR|nr:hypothetical protein BWQ96_10088 [Gracilariopsis chorda]|eukprot:PXF40198.1 hypothetical protein BWQ96_10088 [Gracilariopsis chorda]
MTREILVLQSTATDGERAELETLLQRNLLRKPQRASEHAQKELEGDQRAREFVGVQAKHTNEVSVVAPVKKSRASSSSTSSSCDVDAESLHNTKGSRSTTNMRKQPPDGYEKNSSEGLMRVLDTFGVTPSKMKD